MALHLGIDEAGRGSALGPLVVCGFAMQEEKLGELEALGVRDSKELPPGERERLAKELRKLPARIKVMRYLPSVIDEAVRHKGLNTLEISGMSGMIRLLKPAVAYIDALTNRPRKFGMHLEALIAPQRARIVSENKADTKYPLVQAASIMAKVIRDGAIERLKRVHGDFGSGYPGDLRTRLFLAGLAEKGAKYPPFVRRSWSTLVRLEERFS